MARSRPYAGETILDVAGPGPELGTEAGTRPQPAIELQRAEIAERRFVPPPAGLDDLEDDAWISDAIEDALDEQIAQLRMRVDHGRFNVENAINVLNANAQPNSTGRCATYVRLALDAGGIDMRENPIAAADYAGFLQARGFVRVTGENYMPGDVAVMRAFRGRRKNHPYGHVQMFNGTSWVSDFVQRAFWPGGDYRQAQPEYAVYRFAGTLLPAAQ